MYLIMTCSYAIHTRCVVCAVVSFIAVSEVVLFTLSNKKEFKGNFEEMVNGKTKFMSQNVPKF